MSSCCKSQPPCISKSSLAKLHIQHLENKINKSVESVSGEHDRETQCTTTNIIDSTTESTCMRINHTIYTTYKYPGLNKHRGSAL